MSEPPDGPPPGRASVIITRPSMTPGTIRTLMVVVALAVVALTLYRVLPALFPFLLGAIIAFIISPLVERLAVIQPWYGRNPETARGVAVVVVYGISAAALVVAGLLFVPVLIQEVDKLFDEIPVLAEQAQERVDGWIERYQREVPDDVRDRVNEAVASIASQVGALAQGLVSRSLGIVFSTFAAVLGYIAVPFFVFYSLKDRDRALGRFYLMFPERIRPDARESVRIANRVLGAYVRAQLFLAVVIFAITYTGLRLMGVEFALGLAVIAGLTELIPIIGPLIGFIPALIVVLATEPEHWWWIALFYLGVQAAENYLLVPRVHGQSVHMHPALVLILLTIGGTLFGLWGVLLVVPIAAAIRDVYGYIYRRLGEAEAERRRVQNEVVAGSIVVETSGAESER
jgi:predicted PurR-regulated permease PerM